MTGQPPDIGAIVEERLRLIQAIAAINCELLRLNQIASGLMILDQKDEVDGTDDGTRDDTRDENDTAIDRCRGQIDALETQLADLDRTLAQATGRDTK